MPPLFILQFAYRLIDDYSLEGGKWETMTCAENNSEQFTASYKNAKIIVVTNRNDKPKSTYIYVFPPINPDIKFDSIEDLFRFVKQREDGASTRGAEPQIKHSI